MSAAANGVGLYAWIDASAGVAGDMLLGALVDAGAPLDALQLAVDAVVPGATRLRRSAVTRAGQRATKIDVDVLVDDPPHRTWLTIRDVLQGSTLAASTRDRALRVFAQLAEAESRVHGVPVDDIHFHEVGALDSIADIVGVCAALDALAITTISAGEVAVGAGRISTAHGDIGVPVPAVLELARGWRINSARSGELATPTGMALIAALADVCEDLPALTVQAVGVGAGTKDHHGAANVTRIVVGVRRSAGSRGDTAVQLDTNVDDLDPRLWPGVLTRLLDAGAADAWLTPILMKKGRPAHTLSVLCRAEQTDTIRDVIFTHTSSIGIREHPVTKNAMARAWVDVAVDGAVVAIKLAHRGGVIRQAAPEFDTVSAAAAASSRSPRDVLADAVVAAAAAGLLAGHPLPRHARSSPDKLADTSGAEPESTG